MEVENAHGFGHTKLLVGHFSFCFVQAGNVYFETGNFSHATIDM